MIHLTILQALIAIAILLGVGSLVGVFLLFIFALCRGVPDYENHYENFGRKEGG